jgi:hypothetical protein
MRSPAKQKIKKHPLYWLIEPLTEESSYIEKPMFGCLACYLHGRLTLVLASRKKPWNGLLIPADKGIHDSIRRDVKGVVQHPVLKKWLYLPDTYEDFESEASYIVELVLMNDRRFGVEPKEPVSKKREIARYKKAKGL